MKEIDLSVPQGAIFSEDRCFRYALWRVWRPCDPLLMFIGLNPSKASEVVSDPTVTRMMTRAINGGYGGILVGNLYAYVSTDPRSLLRDGDHVGPENDEYLRMMADLSVEQLCGWGSFKPVWRRFIIVYDMLPRPICLGTNQDGQPKHPLYIGYSIQPEEFVHEHISS